MKKLLIWLLLMILVTPALADGAADDILPECYRYVVQGEHAVYSDWSPVYEAPDENSDVCDRLPHGWLVNVGHHDEDGVFCYVEYEDGKSGYMRKRDLVMSFFLVDAMVVVNDVPGERLNLRTAPSRKSTSLGKYYTGTIVTQLEAEQNGFVKVKVGHVEGYMDAAYLRPGMTCAAPELPVLTVDNASGTGVNVRKLPQNDSEIIQQAPNGAQLTVIAVRSDGWYQVIYAQEVGFARADKLTPKLNYSAE